MGAQQSPEVPGLVDAVTGLPWSAMVHTEAARLALEHDLHAVSLHLNGLSTILDVHGAQTFVAVLRDITRHLRTLLDARDRLSRQSADRLLLITVRPPDETARLLDAVVAGITSAAVEVEGERLPRVYVGIARLPRVGNLAEGTARLDAAILSAEIAASASRGVAAGEVAPPAPPPEPRTKEAVAPEVHREAVPTERPAPPAAAAPGIAAEVPEAGPAAEAPLAAEPRPQAEAVERAAPRGERRLALKGLRLDLSGLVATAVVELAYGDRHAAARSVGRNVEERRLYLLGEAAARAVTDFLPPGHGAVIHDVALVQPGAAELGRGVLAIVLFLEPEKEQFLFGVASADGDARLAAARAVLDAVNRRVALLLPLPDR